MFERAGQMFSHKDEIYAEMNSLLLIGVSFPPIPLAAGLENSSCQDRKVTRGARKKICSFDDAAAVRLQIQPLSRS